MKWICWKVGPKQEAHLYHLTGILLLCLWGIQLIYAYIHANMHRHPKWHNKRSLRLFMIVLPNRRYLKHTMANDERALKGENWKVLSSWTHHPPTSANHEKRVMCYFQSLCFPSLEIKFTVSPTDSMEKLSPFNIFSAGMHRSWFHTNNHLGLKGGFLKFNCRQIRLKNRPKLKTGIWRMIRIQARCFPALVNIIID